MVVSCPMYMLGIEFRSSQALLTEFRMASQKRPPKTASGYNTWWEGLTLGLRPLSFMVSHKETRSQDEHGLLHLVGRDGREKR